MMTAAHEIGHLIDHRALGEGGYTFGSKMDEEMKPLMSSIANSETMKSLRAGEYDYYTKKIDEHEYRIKVLSSNQKRYYKSDIEMFARAYSQYIAVKSKNPQMLSELREEQKSNYYRFTVWPDEEFKPIHAEFDKLFTKKGFVK